MSQRQCLHCAAPLEPAFRFCPYCGRPDSSAGAATQRLGAGEWRAAGGYLVRLHGVQEGAAPGAGPNGAPERCLRLEVEYRNQTAAAQRFALSQWTLADAAGYRYEFELRNQYYGERAGQRLVEGLLAPGEQVRGWVAFKLPPGAVAERVIFRPGYLSDEQAVLGVR
ncbi:MAG TPA: DUF4352 domain-containing protein [Herpetosiphonaceae bacterium]